MQGVKTLSLDSVLAHSDRFPAGRFYPLVGLAAGVGPGKLRRRPFRMVASGMIALAWSERVQEKKKLTIVVPAYNEAATLDTVMSCLLAKDFGEMELEVILVESNSSDGTREIAMRYSQDTRLLLIFEDRPLGKGHAVRTDL